MFKVSYFQTTKQNGSMTKWYHPVILIKIKLHSDCWHKTNRNSLAIFFFFLMRKCVVIERCWNISEEGWRNGFLLLLLLFSLWFKHTYLCFALNKKLYWRAPLSEPALGSVPTIQDRIAAAAEWDKCWYFRGRKLFSTLNPSKFFLTWFWWVSATMKQRANLPSGCLLVSFSNS